jgi:LPS-assembly protein
VRRAKACLRSKSVPRHEGRRRFAASTAAGALLAASILPGFAQTLNPFYSPSLPAPHQQLLLEADEIIYDFDRETVTAVGNVQIYYGASALDAERVIYDKKSGRLLATGGVRLLEPSGNIIIAETIDITDDFRDGFLSSLNVITIDRGYFSAQTAERRNGNLTIFRKGVYTACEPCMKNPARPPLWQIRAARIIHDESEHTVYYQNARLEFFGVPVLYTPVFSHPDPTVKRKTGFLMPSIMTSSAIGFGVTTPFFWNLAPNYDITFAPTYLTRQGVLMEGEWRHRILNGAYSIRLAGIFQQDKDAFREDGDKLSGFRDFRGSARTTADFVINSRWSYGWDLHATTDRTFNRDYNIANATAKDLTSTVYLTGLSDRNFFDLSGYYFVVQREDTEEEIPDGPDPGTDPDLYVHDDQGEQAIVHPVLDHNYILDTPVLGGELRLDSNFTSLSRAEDDIRHPPAPFAPYFAGVSGNFTRATTRASWERRLIGPGGQLITPLAYAQGDLNFSAFDTDAADLDSDEVIGRAMPAIGIEYEWPFLAVLGSTVHTFGPKAQLIARPDEQHVGDLSNEDSQSLVFDDTSLFVLDKFSGYDRQEGGTRANVGFVYQGLFGNGASVDALVGQSYHLAGANSFAMQDTALTGIGSGLETDESDYVGRVTLNTGTGIALTARGRFDDNDLSINRGELNAIGTYGDSVAALGYTFIRQSPSAGIFENRQEINGAAKLEFVDNWSVLGAVIYDLENASQVSHSFGLAYTDECFDLSAVYKETPDPYSDLVTNRTFFVRFNLRTLSDNKLNSQIDSDFN